MEFYNLDQMQSKSRYKPGSTSKQENQDTWISDLDPIMLGGFKIAHQESNFALQVRNSAIQGQSFTLKEVYSLRILILTNGNNNAIIQLKIELDSEDDIFKLYICRLDQKLFQKIKKSQHLNFSFQALVPMLIKQVTLCQKQINEYNAVLYINKISKPRLEFLENIQFKRIELLSLQFQEPNQEAIKNYVVFRFTKVRMNKQIFQKKLKDVLSMTKLKNQNLLADIIKKESLRIK